VFAIGPKNNVIPINNKVKIEPVYDRSSIKKPSC